MKNLFPGIIFFMLSWTLSAQEKIEMINVSEIIETCNQFEDKGDYKNALVEIDKIPKNDSTYLPALTTKAYYLINNDQFEEAIQVCNEGIKSSYYPFKYYFLLNKSSAQLSLKNYDSALVIYDQMLEKYPRNHLIYYNKGIAYLGLKEYEKASKMFQVAITYNPFYANSHLKLGALCYQEHHITQAMMCLSMYLLLNPDGENSLNILSSYNNMVETQNEMEKHPEVELSSDDESFEEIDLIINNYAALDKKYKISNKLVLPIIKQNHAMIKQLSDYEGNGGFWDKYYVPFYQFIDESDLFDVYTYTIAFSVENEKYKTIVNKHINDIKSFITVYQSKWKEIMGQNEKEVNGKNVPTNYYYSDSKLTGIGVIKEDLPIGSWEFFNDYGGLLGFGDFDDEGNKHGKWIWYNREGNITKEEDYNHGLYTNDYFEYYPNGKLHFKIQYTEGEINGKYLEYNNKGALIEDVTYVNGKLEGEYLILFPVGEGHIQYKIPYKNNLIEGKVVELNANGQIITEMLFKEGKKEGIQTEYYNNGEIKSKKMFQNGNLNGEYSDYHVNNNLKRAGNCVDDFYEGIWKTYYYDGSIEEECNYSKGKLDGILKQFEPDGHLLSEYRYRKGEVIAYTFYGKSGEVIKEGKKQKGEFYYEGHAANGNIVAEGLYDISGGKMEEWKYYSDNHFLSSKSFYNENNLDGNTVQFYTNGEISQITPYKNDTLEGYYTEYYPTKQLKEQGWYNNDNLQGTWLNYYPDGTLQSTNYYTNGKLYGWSELYAVDGKIHSKIFYQDNEKISEYSYTPEGNPYEEVNWNVDSNTYHQIDRYVNGNIRNSYEMLYAIKHGKYYGNYFAGQPSVTGQFVNGERNGEWIWYHENGKINTIGNYILGLREGVWKDYHDNGKLKQEYLYVNGNQEGIETNTNQEGVIIQTLEYTYDELNGQVCFYSEEGNLQLIRYYQHGTLVGYSYLDANSQLLPMIPIENETGKIISYFDNGKIAREMEYINGEFNNNYKEYYYSGQLCEEHHYTFGDRQGFDKTYYPDGTLKEEQNYDHNYIIGDWKKYHPNGKIKEIIPMLNGDRNGLGTTYDDTGKPIKETLYFDGDIFSEKKL